jgi:TetR/AcrR family transcriptional regulator, transcriptional repressor for nem operon
MKHFSDITPTAERIVDLAEMLVQQHGYNGFSYDDIAQQIGIRKPSVHHHFRTKTELVSVVAQRYTHRFNERLEAIQKQHADAAGRLRAYAKLFEHTFEQDRRLCVCGMLGAEADGLPAEVSAEVARFFKLNLDWLEQVLAQGQRAQQVRKETKAAALAELFLCSLEGAMVVGRGTRDGCGPRHVARTALASLLL